MKKNCYIALIMFVFLMMFYKSSSADVPQGTGGKPIVSASSGGSDIDATTIHIGSSIEDFFSEHLTTPLKNKLTNKSYAQTAIKLMTALFLLDFMMCMGTAYLKEDYNSLVPTFVMKSFFYIAVKTGLEGGSFLLIISGIVEKAVVLPAGSGSASLSSWFRDGLFANAVTASTKNGVLTQVDTLVSTVWKSFVDAGFWDNYVWVVAYFFIIISLFLYGIGLILMLTMILKCFEWAIGLPFAFVMLAGKGHPLGDQYATTGAKYIFYVAIDFLVFMSLFAIGSQLVTGIVSDMVLAKDVTNSMLGIVQLFTVATLWWFLVMNTESIVAGISDGAPQFSSAMAKQAIAMGKMLSSAMSKPTSMVTNAGKAMYNAKVNGTSMMAAATKSVAKDTFGKITKDRDGNIKFDTKGSAMGIMSDLFTKDTSKGLRWDNKTEQVTDKKTGITKNVTKKVSSYQDGGLGNFIGEHKNKIESSISESQNFNKLMTKNGTSLTKMRGLGLNSREHQLQYLNNFNEFERVHSEITKYGGQPHTQNGKLRNIQDMKKEITDLKEKAENNFNSMPQRAYSSSSNLTKEMKKGLNVQSGNQAGQVEVLKNWLNEGLKNPTEFSKDEFKNSVKTLSESYKASGNIKGLDKFRSVMNNEIGKISLKSDNNQFFNNVLDPELRTKNNQALKTHLNLINKII